MGRKAEVSAFGKEETPTLAGTARYGPVRRVVWDPWLAERGSVSHGDPIRFIVHSSLGVELGVVLLPLQAVGDPSESRRACRWEIYCARGSVELRVTSSPRSG
jgi:hypothetical protein